MPGLRFFDDIEYEYAPVALQLVHAKKFQIFGVMLRELVRDAPGAEEWQKGLGAWE